MEQRPVCEVCRKTLTWADETNIYLKKWWFNFCSQKCHDKYFEKKR